MTFAPPVGWLDHSAATRPGAPAVADAGEALTYAELRREAGAMAAHLAGAGVAPGDPVAIDLPPGTGHAIALHGALLAGAVAQSLPASGREGIAVALGAAFVGADELAAARRAGGSFEAPARDPGAPLTRVLSSGTSGEPKPVELSAANHLWSALASALNLGLDPADRWLCCLPLNHVGGLSILLRSAIYGTAALIHERFDAERVAAAISAGEASIVSLVPTQLVRLLDAGADLKRPRLLLIGGGPLPADVLAESLERGATAVQTYGLTETCSQVCTLAPAEAMTRAGSAGKPLLGTEVAIEDGQIAVRGPTVAPGAAGADGWLRTGDLGRLDGEGYLWVEGRRSDLIVSGGENVRPERVEEALRALPGVADAGVAGRPDREWGQIVCAWVVPRPGARIDPGELTRAARGRLAPAEVPKRVEIAAELPRTASGKLLRRKLG